MRSLSPQEPYSCKERFSDENSFYVLKVDFVRLRSIFSFDYYFLTVLFVHFSPQLSLERGVKTTEYLVPLLFLSSLDQINLGICL